MYPTGVGHDVGDVLRVFTASALYAPSCAIFRVIWNDEREALTVDDMPMRHVDLGIVEADQADTHIKEVNDTHVYPGHRGERAFNVRKWKAKA